MKTKTQTHTPGPWIQGAIEHGSLVFNFNGKEVCRVTPTNDAETQANRRLIAAAPELLAALKAYEAGRISCNYQCGECGQCLGRAAIAKATGQEAK